MAQQNTFNFTAKFEPFKENSKVQTLSFKPETGYKKLNLKLNDGKSNQILSIGKSAPRNGEITVQLKNEDGKYKYTKIKYEDRFNAEIVDNVNPFKKFVLDLGERKEFVFELDYIEALYEAVTNGLLNDKVLFVSGDVERKVYKGKTYRSFLPRFVSYAKSERMGFFGLQSFIFDKESLDDSMLKTEYKFEVNGWVETYSSEHKATLMIPETFTFDFSNVKSEENEERANKIKAIAEYVKDKFKVRKGYYEYGFEVLYVNGSETTDIELKDLSKDLQIQIELGLTTFEQAKRAMGLKTEYKTQTRLVRPDNKNYLDGVLVRDELEEEDFIIRDVVEVKSVSEIQKEVVKEIETPTVKEETLDDLFDSLI